MKKLFLLACIVLLFLSCNNNSVNNDNEVKFFTVTYHGNGHTSGEPPVDPQEYKLPHGMPSVYDYAVILDKGTLEKEMGLFGGWMAMNPNGELGLNRIQPGESYPMDADLHLYAYWYTITK